LNIQIEMPNTIPCISSLFRY